MNIRERCKDTMNKIKKYKNAAPRIWNSTMTCCIKHTCYKTGEEEVHPCKSKGLNERAHKRKGNREQWLVVKAEHFRWKGRDQTCISQNTCGMIIERFFFIISIAMFGSENICACAFCVWPLGTWSNPFSYHDMKVKRSLMHFFVEKQQTETTLC